jgi:peptidoglycan/xylan/chitin deacetylase (PgdA/CDA1 family)
VVPAYNEEDLLPRCLEALIGQRGGRPHEIIVVNNASTDGTAAVARAYGVRVVDEPVRGYSRALARGFAAATGDVIASTDADSEVPRDWIARLVAAYRSDPSIVAVGGAIRFTDPNLKGRIFTDLLLPLIDHVDWSNPRGPHLWGANLSIRRDAFLRVGGFNPHFSLQADSEISERLRAEGRVVLLPDLRVKSSSRRWNQAFWSSGLLFGMNFVWYHAFRRPMCREFPAIRETPANRDAAAIPAQAGPGANGVVAGGVRGRAGRLAGLLLGFVTALGLTVYSACIPRSNAFGHTVWNVPTSRRVVALTFDDGPNSRCTPRILEILRQEHVHATFFLIGSNVRREPEVAAAIVRDGNVVGNHSDSHPYGFAWRSTSFLSAELAGAEKSVEAATGVYPRFFRPPNGLRSPWLMQTLKRDSLTAITWDDAAGDWDPMAPDEIVRRTVARAHPGSIILLHDGMNLQLHPDQTQTVEALPGIIRELRSQGYEFVTVPELLGRAPYLSRWRG